LRDLDLERLLGRDRCRERDLVVAMVVQRLIGPGSKLSATRRFAQTTLGDELSLGEVTEAELLAAMDWLLERQDRIERTFARRHLPGDGERKEFALYDLSLSYIEGRPVGVRVHAGNVTDQQTVPDTVRMIQQDFGIEQVVFVGDRGMITQAHAQTLKEQGVDFISALKSCRSARW